jgi:hypothetical protein
MLAGLPPTSSPTRVRCQRGSFHAGSSCQCYLNLAIPYSILLNPLNYSAPHGRVGGARRLGPRRVALGPWRVALGPRRVALGPWSLVAAVVLGRSLLAVAVLGRSLLAAVVLGRSLLAPRASTGPRALFRAGRGVVPRILTWYSSTPARLRGGGGGNLHFGVFRGGGGGVWLLRVPVRSGLGISGFPCVPGRGLGKGSQQLTACCKLLRSLW